MVEPIGIIEKHTIISDLVGARIQPCDISDDALQKSGNLSDQTEIEHKFPDRKPALEQRSDQHQIRRAVLQNSQQRSDHRGQYPAQAAALIPPQNIVLIVPHHLLQPVRQPVELDVLRPRKIIGKSLQIISFPNLLFPVRLMFVIILWLPARQKIRCR